MSANTADQHSIYRPNPEEKRRQDFVLALKFLANGLAQRRVREAYETIVKPAVAAKLGRDPAVRAEAEPELARTSEFRHWAVLTHHSQSMMWAAIEKTTRRLEQEARERLARVQAERRAGGSLELDPGLEIPPPISNTEIHRQPGGFVGSSDPLDLTPGMRYFGAQLIYAVGKGNPAAAGDGRAQMILDKVRERFPQLRRPARILDLGCGSGVASQGIAREFPEAEYHGVDVAAGVLRFGHLLAEERGIPIHFHQRDAARTGFDAQSFDLIVSNIFFHETNSARLPQTLRECRRLLRPGGAMVHVDVANQVARHGLADQCMTHWQVRWNGEPFFTGFAERNLRQELEAAGFAPEQVFAEYIDKPGGAFYTFGARG